VVAVLTTFMVMGIAISMGSGLVDLADHQPHRGPGARKVREILAPPSPLVYPRHSMQASHHSMQASHHSMQASHHSMPAFFPSLLE